MTTKDQYSTMETKNEQDIAKFLLVPRSQFVGGILFLQKKYLNILSIHDHYYHFRRDKKKWDIIKLKISAPERRYIFLGRIPIYLRTIQGEMVPTIHIPNQNNQKGMKNSNEVLSLSRSSEDVHFCSHQVQQINPFSH